MMRNTASRPLKGIHASAYPAIAASSTGMMVEGTAIANVFHTLLMRSALPRKLV